MAEIVIAAVIIGGAIVKTIGDVQSAQAKAKADEQKASQLEELSNPGGYYDQSLAAINAELKDVEADRTAAGKLLAISSLEITKQGAQATGQITAAAGAGNLAQTGSIAQRKGVVSEAVSLNLAKSRLQYEDQLRGLATRQASDTAQETKINFEKSTGLQDASSLRNEADWLNTWGVGLAIAGGIFGAGGAMVQAGFGGGGKAFSTDNSGGPPANAASIASGTVNYPDPYISVASGSPSYWRGW